VKTRIAFLFIAGILIAVVSSGCGAQTLKQSSSTPSGKLSSKSVKDLVIDKVTFFKKDHPEAYYVVGQIKNNNNKVVCSDAAYTVNLYDDSNRKLGTDTGKLPPIFPEGQLWFLSVTIDTDYVSPTRAELKVKPNWKPYDPKKEAPKGKILEAHYLPDPRTGEATVVGTYEYPGLESRELRINAVLLNSAGDPVDAYYFFVDGLPAIETSNPFEIKLGHVLPDVASVETSIFEWPGEHIIW